MAQEQEASHELKYSKGSGAVGEGWGATARQEDPLLDALIMAGLCSCVDVEWENGLAVLDRGQR